MSDNGDVAHARSRGGLAAYQDARALVRLLQCSQCSRPLRTPVTLPCGNSVCRECLPQTHLRENISYPNAPDRHYGFQCPFPGCGEEHPLADCSVDVVLYKILESVAMEVSRSREASDNTPTALEEVMQWGDIPEDEKISAAAHARTLNGGRLVATFTFAELGELGYLSEVTYRSLSPTGDAYEELDKAFLERLREGAHKEVDCQVCYALLLDPVTTSCGHTFCRKCLVRVLDHAEHCPMCRRQLLIPASLARQPSNKTLSTLLYRLCPDIIEARAEAVRLDELGPPGGLDTPLFIVTLGFPSMPTFLHVFEPRYRLMIRRAMEGNGTFGIMMYNRLAAPQGDLGVTQFMQYGTLLRIVSVQMLPDGRSLIETRGISRFKVLEHGQRDGYTVGRVERVEDVSLTEEERLEAEETTAPISLDADAATQIDHLSTRQLLFIGIEFILKMQRNSAPWLHQRILDAYGGPPDDPASFPYWFASILPIDEEEKYKLLLTTSVRGRLKITASWIRRIESQRWYALTLNLMV
ncbi:hypothetical protein EV356DRAFT_248417 [Viridothelium virens]|uniref:ATP-dependent protease n=1 Tax=Viridothelium virens TaxID=1048519 RepID=A0A6A6H3S8_VIRVR|nr:hypothetical protein EV356DRAFT_248417 [Viridothelium virens]